MKDSIRDSLQEQLVAARRNQILDAATKVFAEKGFHSTTIRDIARVAGIADGTIYNYFENKMALLLGILDRLNESDRREEDFSKFSGGDFRSFMKAYVRHRLHVLKAGDFEVIRIVISEVLVNKELREIYTQRIFAPTFALAEKYFQQWVSQRMIKPIDIELTMRAVSGMVLGIIVEYVMGDELLQERWDDLPDVITDLILDGLLERSDRP